MRRLLPALLALTLLVPTSLLAGCKQRTVTVKTGQIVLCTAGEVLADETQELEVPADEVSQYSVTTRVVTCPAHGSLADLYRQAQQSIADGDLDTAREKLATIVERDPGYGKAKEQLDEIEAGGTPEPDTDTGGSTEPTTTPGGEEPTGPIANLIAFVPDVLEGYSAQEIIADPVILTRVYLPLSGNADQLVITAEQMVDARAAEAGLNAAKSTYPENRGTVDLAGTAGYFGTRGDYAAVVFADGAILVTVEMHAGTGGAKDLRSAAVAVATAIAK